MVYVRQPAEGVLGMEPGQLLKMEKEVYGTVRRLAAWREALLGFIHSLGYTSR